MHTPYYFNGFRFPIAVLVLTTLLEENCPVEENYIVIQRYYKCKIMYIQQQGKNITNDDVFITYF